MVDLGTAANIAEIAGGAAILVSLLYVGYQIRQSNHIARAAALQTVLEGFSDRTIAQQLEHPETIDLQVRGHHCYSKLNRYDKSMFGAMLNRDVFHMQNVMQFRQHGLISDVDFHAWLVYTAALLTTPGGRDCWQIMRVSYTPTIVTLIEDFIASNPTNPSLIELYPSVYGTVEAPAQPSS